MLIAGYGAGIFDDIAKTVEYFAAIGDTITPDHNHDAVYEKMYACYKEQFDALGGIYFWM